MRRLMGDPSEIDRVLIEGAARAELIARLIFGDIYDIVGFLKTDLDFRKIEFGNCPVFRPFYFD